MKKYLLIIPLIALALSCGPKGNSYQIKGTVTDSLGTDPTAKVVLVHYNGVMEEAPVVDGKFSFTGEANDDICNANLLINDRPAGRGSAYSAPVILEKGVIKVDIGKESTVKGGKLNKAFTKYTDEISAVVLSFQEKLNGLGNEMGQEAAAEKAAELQEEANESIVKIAKKTFEANSDNAVGLTALLNIVSDLSLEELEDCLAKASDFITENESIKRIHTDKLAAAATEEGSMFVDFSGKTPDGKDVKLSDFVGKGKYALVDFWASWCGPCKREIPNIKEIYETYGKKINVVGVAVWDGDNSGSRSVMKELGMKWNQIFVGEDKTATDTYGIAGIPHIILFAPDGTILKRNLRGTEMFNAVVEVME